MTNEETDWLGFSQPCLEDFKASTMLPWLASLTATPTSLCVLELWSPSLLPTLLGGRCSASILTPTLHCYFLTPSIAQASPDGSLVRPAQGRNLGSQVSLSSAPSAGWGCGRRATGPFECQLHLSCWVH